MLQTLRMCASFDRKMGRHSRTSWIGAIRLTASRRFHSSLLISCVGPRWATPALLTRIFNRPHPRSTFSTKAVISSGREIAVHGPYFDAVGACLARHWIDFEVIDIDQIKIDAFTSEGQPDRASDSGRCPGHQRLLSAQH